MANSKDLLNFSVIQKKTNKESITPHKIAVVLLIREFCLLKMKGADQLLELVQGNIVNIEPHHRRNFCILILKLIQCPDLDLPELLALMMSDKHKLVPALVQIFQKKLLEIYQKGVESIQDLIQGLGRLMVEPSPLVPPIVNKSSVIGLYIRRIMVLFDKLSFSQVVGIFKSFKLYYQAILRVENQEESKSSGNDMELSICMDEKPSVSEVHLKQLQGKDANRLKGVSSAERGCWSRRQAELFIAQQALYMQTNETSCLSPSVLQERIKELLHANPEFAEAHFLSYLNCLRVREFCGAVDSLYHCFDRNSLPSDSKGNNQEEKSKGYRYAALNLAILHVHFDHKKEALCALKEAIMMAHEANDNVCLQHALAWLYKLGDENKEVLMERSISKSSDLNLSYLTSLGIQSFAQYAGITGGKPGLVFDLLARSDVLNCQHSMIDLMTNSYAQKAALWCLFGKNEMMSLCSQLLLHLNTSNPTQGIQSYNGEGTCQAICNVANILVEQGEYKLASVVLMDAKQRFPNEPISHAWMFCENILCFTKAMHLGHWQEAERAVINLSAIDKWESQLRKAELLMAKGDFTGAATYVYGVLDFCRHNPNSGSVCPSLRLRALTLTAELQCCCCTMSSASAGAISLLTTALAVAHVHYLDYLGALVRFHLANFQLQMGLPSQALKLIDQSLLVILSHGGCYDQGRALLLYAKCKVASAAAYHEAERRQIISDAVQMLNKVKTKFQKVEAYYRMKDVLYLQALLYNELGCDAERNRCALEFKQLEEQYPLKLSKTLLNCL